VFCDIQTVREAGSKKGRVLLYVNEKEIILREERKRRTFRPAAGGKKSSVSSGYLVKEKRADTREKKVTLTCLSPRLKGEHLDTKPERETTMPHEWRGSLLSARGQKERPLDKGDHRPVSAKRSFIGLRRGKRGGRGHGRLRKGKNSSSHLLSGRGNVSGE